MSRRKRHFQRVQIADPNLAPPHVARWLRIVQWTAIVAAAVLIPTALVAQVAGSDLPAQMLGAIGMGFAFLAIMVRLLRIGTADTNWGFLTRSGTPFRFWLWVFISCAGSILGFLGGLSLALGWSTPPDRAQRSQQRTCSGTPRK